ncbi:MAG: TolB family protein [Candidatus Promineifilaceae bacterium]
MFPIKPPLIAWGSGGGDGYSPEEFYLARDAPDVTIYADGQVILTVGTYGYQQEGPQFLDTSTSELELCNLFQQLAQTGYYNWGSEAEYNFDDTTQFSDGGGSFWITTNWPWWRQFFIYAAYIPYLKPEMDAAFQLVTQYQATRTKDLYLPERLVLWIEDANPVAMGEDMNAVNWPANLPSLGQLWQDRASNRINISGDLIQPVLELFDYRSTDFFVFEGEHAYWVIPRPLLPHESLEATWPTIPVADIDLPIDCPLANLPEVTATSTPAAPTATPTLEAGLSALAGLGRIAFASDRNGNEEIYLMNADGTGVLNLTNHPAADGMPAWSPDGRKIAFASDRSGNEEIYVMDADGSNVTRLTYDAAHDEWPAWSPDGEQITFVRSIPDLNANDLVGELLTMKADGSDVTSTSDHTSVKSQPAWSPDGRILAFSDGILYLLQPDGSTGRVEPGFDPSWSPDGRWLAYQCGHQRICVRDIYGTDWSGIRMGNSQDSSPSPDWSPDGRYLVFVSDRDERYSDEIYVMTIDGSSTFRLTFDDASASDPDWWP